MKRSPSGFSLLEVLVAVTIIGFGFSIVFAGMSGSLRGLERVKSTELHVEQARLILAQLDLIKKILPGDTAAGEFADGTRWKLETSTFTTPVAAGPQANPGSILRVTLTMEWMGQNSPQQQVIETYRYTLPDGAPVRPLEEQIRELQ